MRQGKSNSKKNADDQLPAETSFVCNEAP